MTLRSELLSYSSDVISGAVPACKKHRWACMRFLSDIKRIGTDDFPYVFIEAKAERLFDWARLFKHRKGVLKGKPIEPHIIHKFIFGNVYGWYHKDTGYRRFNKLYWQVARKNSKSQWLSIVASFETMAFDESGIEANEVYVGATKSDQAKIVYDEAVAMLDGSTIKKANGKIVKTFAGSYTVAYGRLVHKRSGSVFRPLSEEDRKTGDGLNPQCGIIDEYHAHETSEIYDVIDSGMGARAQPLLAIITTAGFELSNPCYRVEYDLVSKILNPDIPVELDSYFVMVNELDCNNTDQVIEIGSRKVAPGDVIDDIKDESVWVKANPIICSYPEGVGYLRKKLKEALEAPEKMRNFLTKHMNIWVNQRVCGYMQMDKWGACYISAESRPNVEGLRVFSGLDLSATIDITSVGFEIPLSDGCYLVRQHSFIPEETLEKRRKTDKMPFDLWVFGGWITATEGAEVDYHFILEYLEEEYKRNGWSRGEICYDKALATWLTHELTEKQWTPIEVPQSYMGLSPATKDFRAKVYNKKIIHENDPVLTWAISNAVTRAGPSENLMLDKSKSRQRIDPIAALINAHTRAMVADPGWVYNERGIRSLV